MPFFVRRVAENPPRFVCVHLVPAPRIGKRIATVAEFCRDGCDRPEALRRMTLRYIEHMHTNAPVHTWPVGA